MRQTIQEWWDLVAVASVEDAALAADDLRLRAENVRLRRSLASRPVIDQACGMAMALVPCTRAEARSLLMGVSRHCEVTLRDVAVALVATTQGRTLSEEMQREVRRAVRRSRAAHR